MAKKVMNYDTKGKDVVLSIKIEANDTTIDSNITVQSYTRGIIAHGELLPQTTLQQADKAVFIHTVIQDDVATKAKVSYLINGVLQDSEEKTFKKNEIVDFDAMIILK